MKTSKKITIAALSAATALVGATGAVSSFAWFAMNSSVTATGMQIKADSTNAFLEIKESTKSWPDNDGSSIKAVFESEGPKVLSPTHLIGATTETSLTDISTLAYSNVNGSKHSWVASTSKDANDHASNGTYTVVTGEADQGSKYTLLASFDLRLRYTESAKDNAYTLKANIDWSEATDAALADTARVFMVVSGTNDQKIEINNESSKGFEFNARTKNGWGKEAETPRWVEIKEDFKANSSNLGTRVSLFFYFDGEDVDCKTVNAVTDSTYSITATFSVENA